MIWLIWRDDLNGDVLDWVLELRASIGIPATLAEIGINDEGAETVGHMASVDPSAATNPMAFSSAQYAAVFSNAVQGRLGV